MSDEGLRQAQELMAADGLPPQAIAVFSRFYRDLESGATGMVHEADIDPLQDVTALADVQIGDDEQRSALAQTAIIKLNGGIGTSMGMEQAKSLLPVRGALSFLDVIVRQVLHLRQTHDVALPLVFMNSFRTRDDTLRTLAGYPELAIDGLPADFLQNREPKLRADDLTPAQWPADPSMQWCPPGHGDLYTALSTSGILEALLDKGFRYASVSNSDNLGAAPDPRIAGWFAASGAPYAAEVCTRTAADVKGGYLVVRKADGRLVLRETAQTPKEEVALADDITRHRYFHTNNLWFDLRVLADTLTERDGVLGLPLIRNAKTVDPSDSSSTPVIQIESAMGAAVEVFDGAVALQVPRSRFLPVKTTNDLLLVRSDVYRLDERGRLVSDLPAGADDPLVDLDSRFFKLVKGFEQRFPAGPPSLRHARSLTVRGDWTFGAEVTARGDAVLAERDSPGTVPDGTVLGD
ncbi:UTP--glucose-1-phosphate uridylyltransferase [Nakamurella sp. A5-74]|uniref:UTP--glucose-1-phosphate uridylyltransferase n=1 Tax=Nakamurella sp. A5-74 TaxID=3158264 RepID=A0AAU8DLW1_9ACTN